MKLTLNKNTMSDELYNMLLQTFVNEAVMLDVNVTGQSKFENWEVSCEIKQPVH